MEQEEQDESALAKVLSKLKKENRDNDSLRKKNEKLKKELNKLKNTKTVIIENKKLKEENKEMVKAISELKEEVKELRNGYLNKEHINLDKDKVIDQIANKLENMEQKLAQISAGYITLDEIDKVQLENKIDQVRESSAKAEGINKTQNSKDEKNNEKENLYDPKVEDMQKQVDVTTEKGEIVNNINTKSASNLEEKGKNANLKDKSNTGNRKVINIKDKEIIKKELQRLESKGKSNNKETKNKDKSVAR